MAAIDIEDFRRKLRRVERDIFNMTKSESNCCGVTSAQCHALLELSFLEEASVKELAAAMSSDKSNLSRTIDSLVKGELVIRESSTEDRRTLKVKLSEKGRKKVDYINTLCNEYYGKILEQIEPAKQEALVESLTLLSQAISRVEECGLTICSLQSRHKEEDSNEG